MDRQHRRRPEADALEQVGDALPALGIVAVLAIALGAVEVVHDACVGTIDEDRGVLLIDDVFDSGRTISAG